MKKHLKLALGALWAGVMIFIAVQVVSAEVVSYLYTIEGTITSMTGEGLVIDEATVNGETEQGVHVYGMGPAAYWALEEVAFPGVGDKVLIEAYYKNGKYVAASIDNITQDKFIELREVVSDSAVVSDIEEDIHLIPLWSNSRKLSSETEATGLSAPPADCACDCGCCCQEDGCDCACDCEDCLGNQKQEKKKKQRNK